MLVFPPVRHYSRMFPSLSLSLSRFIYFSFFSEVDSLLIRSLSGS